MSLTKSFTIYNFFCLLIFSTPRELKDNLGSDDPEGDIPVLLQAVLARNPNVFREKSMQNRYGVQSGEDIFLLIACFHTHFQKVKLKVLISIKKVTTTDLHVLPCWVVYCRSRLFGNN